MKRLWVHRQRAEQYVVHLAHGAADRVIKDLAFLKFLEVQPCHRIDSLSCLTLPCRSRRDEKSNGAWESRSTGVREKPSMRAASEEGLRAAPSSGCPGKQTGREAVGN